MSIVKRKTLNSQIITDGENIIDFKEINELDNTSMFSSKLVCCDTISDGTRSITIAELRETIDKIKNEKEDEEEDDELYTGMPEQKIKYVKWEFSDNIRSESTSTEEINAEVEKYGDSSSTKYEDIGNHFFFEFIPLETYMEGLTIHNSILQIKVFQNATEGDSFEHACDSPFIWCKLPYKATPQYILKIEVFSESDELLASFDAPNGLNGNVGDVAKYSMILYAELNRASLDPMPTPSVPSDSLPSDQTNIAPR